ncbi:MAG: alpha/beta hydrolase [Actinomycetia bacterium]|nr:alpha/beta hydrolase [Actinomycetes bacterium]
MIAWPAPTMTPLGRQKLAVYDFGPPSGPSGGDVVLLHGMADVARSLEPLAQSLVDDYRVVAFDARGHGRSSHPGAYSQFHFVGDLLGVLDACRIENPILLGHSLGGHTVANFAGLYPDRVRGAVLMEGLGPPSAPMPDTAKANLDHARAMIGVVRSSPHHRPQPDLEAAAARLAAIHPRLDPDRALVLAEEGTIPGPDGGRVWRHDERTWHWVSSVDNRALGQRWAAITAPVLVISGGEAWDNWWARPGRPTAGRLKMTDEQFAARLGLFADVEHVELAEAGHMVHFDQPERINQLVNDFLDRRVVDSSQEPPQARHHPGRSR